MNAHLLPYRTPGNSCITQRFAALILLAVAEPAFAQIQSGNLPATDTVTVVAGPRYAASALHRWLFGSSYRRLWTTPLRVPVLDLDRFAGGLTPLERGGGRQTASLRLRGADGVEYAFRSVDKDPTAILPEDLRQTLARELVQDQISASHPVGALIVAPILEAAGVLHPEPALAHMPDDPRLGPFRTEFANLVGLIEERPHDGVGAFTRARDVISTEDLLNELEENPHARVDARAFLTARLVDLLLGDWDRHRDQWRWARYSDTDTASWQPVSRDRDQAFSRYEGLIVSMARERAIELQNFGPEYGDIVGAAWVGRDLDRNFLTALEWPVWDSTARATAARLTDSVIEHAVARLPAEYRALDSARLASALKRRRAGLPAYANRYYLLLAREVDVRASDRNEVARVHVENDGSTRVELMERTGSTRSAPFFMRRFLPDETKDVRIYLLGGNDHTVITGNGTGGPAIRVIGGGGNDVFADSSRARRADFYDDRGDNHVDGGTIDTRSYVARPDTTSPYPHRDWGHRSYRGILPGIAADIGFLLTLYYRRVNYAFRSQPFASEWEVRADAATAVKSGRLSLGYTRYRENSRNWFGLDALVSGIEVLHFHGPGNQSADTLPADAYRVRQLQARIALTTGLTFGSGTTLAIGPVIKQARTNVDEGDNAQRLIGMLRPYGVGNVTQAGILSSFRLDSRDVSGNPTRGLLLEVDAFAYPAAFGLDHSFATIAGSLATWLSADLPLHPVLALRAGGEQVFGDYPFHEAAFLGGHENLRPFRTDRFAGDAALFGNAELRLELAHLFILVPGTQGIFGYTDAGRVFLQGEDSNRWHTGAGGGVWFAALDRGNVIQISAASSTEGARIYAGIGFQF
jgi:hypothetical protein